MDATSNAVLFIDITEEGKFEIQEEAAELLADIKDPVVVIAITGPRSTGKSYLLNRLFPHQPGFSVGNPTKGIWMQIYSIERDGKSKDVIVLDVEGIEESQEKSKREYTKFALTVVLSSYLIYNSLGPINKHSVMFLRHLVELKHVVQVSHSIEEAEDFSKFFPPFLWVVRDFEGDRDDATDDREYLENSLKVKGLSNMLPSTEFKRVCKRIVKYFEDRDCFTIPPPLTSDAEALVATENLNPEFNQKMENLCNEILAKAAAKHILITEKTERRQIFNLHPVSGISLLLLARECVNAINSGQKLSIPHMWQKVVETTNNSALEQALSHYKEGMDNAVRTMEKKNNIIALDELTTAHKEALASALEILCSQAINNDPTEILPWKTKLEATIACYSDDGELQSGIFHEIVQKKIATQLSRSRSGSMPTFSVSPSETRADVMISMHCATMMTYASKLKKFLSDAGYSVFLCDQMKPGDHYRDEISFNAASCEFFIPFINDAYCNSKECDFEFNIALRNKLSKGRPQILPLLLEDFTLYELYPSISGLLCSTNGHVVKEQDLGDHTWREVVDWIQSATRSPTSLRKSASLDFSKTPAITLTLVSAQQNATRSLPTQPSKAILSQEKPKLFARLSSKLLPHAAHQQDFQLRADTRSSQISSPVRELNELSSGELSPRTSANIYQLLTQKELESDFEIAEQRPTSPAPTQKPPQNKNTPPLPHRHTISSHEFARLQHSMNAPHNLLSPHFQRISQSQTSKSFPHYEPDHENDSLAPSVSSTPFARSPSPNIPPTNRRASSSFNEPPMFRSISEARVPTTSAHMANLTHSLPTKPSSQPPSRFAQPLFSGTTFLAPSAQNRSYNRSPSPNPGGNHERSDPLSVQESSDSMDVPKPCWTHHIVTHDFYLSYYEATEGKAQIPTEPKGGFVEVMYETLSKAPNCVVFWDKKCYNYGHSWEKSFMNGLRTAKVIILLVSNKAFDSIIEATSRNKQSNILVEYECALIQNKLRDVPVFPVWLSEVDYSKFPDIPHVRKSNIQREIDSLSSSMPHDEDFLDTVSKTMEEISKLMGQTLLTRADKAELENVISLLMQVLENTNQIY